MNSFRNSLGAVASACLLLAACGGGSNGTGGAGTSGGTAGNSGAAGNGSPGTAGTSGGTAGNGQTGTAGTTGTAGQGNSGAAGSGVAGSGGATGSAGTGGAQGAAGSAGGGTAGATGTAGAAGAQGAAGTTGGRGGSGGSAAGSGGTTGSGGRGGTTGTAGSGGAQGTAGGNGQCPTGAIFCADFESGSIPTQAVYYPDYQRTMMSMYMTVDSTVAHGGTHSLKITPGGNFSQMLGVMTGTATFWTRFYLRSEVDTVSVSGHDTFVLATDGNGDPNAGQHIRIGEHSCQLEINRKTDDKEILSDAVNGNSMYMCSGGIAPMKNTWYCMEVFYDGPNSTVRVFVDSTESTALHVTDWGPYTYDMFKFGFENYGGTARNIWYDDVAIATQRIGCQ
jgi:hypothetical protein